MELSRPHTRTSLILIFITLVAGCAAPPGFDDSGTIDSSSSSPPVAQPAGVSEPSAARDPELGSSPAPDKEAPPSEPAQLILQTLEMPESGTRLVAEEPVTVSVAYSNTGKRDVVLGVELRPEWGPSAYKDLLVAAGSTATETLVVEAPYGNFSLQYLENGQPLATRQLVGLTPPALELAVESEWDECRQSGTVRILLTNTGEAPAKNVSTSVSAHNESDNVTISASSPTFNLAGGEASTLELAMQSENAACAPEREYLIITRAAGDNVQAQPVISASITMEPEWH